MNIISLRYLTNLIRCNLYLFYNYDLIVGVQNSGLLCASIISKYTNIPITSEKLFFENSFLYGGSTTLKIRKKKIKNVLFLDDTFYTGKTFENIKKKIKIKKLKIVRNYNNINFATIFIEKHKVKKIDFTLEYLNYPHITEWNLSRNQYLKYINFDLDGVICVNPNHSQSVNSKLYLDFIKKTPILFKPLNKINYIITSRRSKYRKITEAWLSRNNVKYKKLIMYDNHQKKNFNNVVEYKIKKNKKYSSMFYIESEIDEAKHIAKKINTPVICFKNFEIYDNKFKLINKYNIYFFFINFLKRINYFFKKTIYNEKNL